MKIKFSNVGRDKKTWTDDIHSIDGMLSEAGLIASVKRNRALMSTDLDFADDGTILVGGYREVGRWEIVT